VQIVPRYAKNIENVSDCEGERQPDRHREKAKDKASAKREKRKSDSKRTEREKEISMYVASMGTYKNMCTNTNTIHVHVGICIVHNTCAHVISTQNTHKDMG